MRKFSKYFLCDSKISCLDVNKKNLQFSGNIVEFIDFKARRSVIISATEIDSLQINLISDG